MKLLITKIMRIFDVFRLFGYYSKPGAFPTMYNSF